MDERIMKVLEAAGARIADLEADLAEYKDANTYVCGQRDAAQDEIESLKAEVETLSKTVSEKQDSVLYWFEQYYRIEGELKALTADRANVEAVD